jgi:predicted metal-binding protein
MFLCCLDSRTALSYAFCNYLYTKACCAVHVLSVNDTHSIPHEHRAVLLRLFSKCSNNSAVTAKMISPELQEKSKDKSGTGLSKDVISKVRPFYSALVEDPFEVRPCIRTPNAHIRMLEVRVQVTFFNTSV